ncbi:hypothetical protein DdX_20339 [Ditylenchus destructor]|uniref:F-box domain-containing protein n=1 Tax=Ditylenchus destructor TaxID=166010 RepID=A0AAD4MI78_9BILA|nr:hypothetical protein DdX_20339 [Ditylenchus destructor]
MDNGTMVEAFKFLNYYQLAKSSLVSKRFWNLIRTHRHKLALLHHSYFALQDPAVIKIFNEKLSPKEYNEWIMRNGYSKQVPHEGQIVGKECSGNFSDIYQFSAIIYNRYANVHQDPNNRHGIATTVFYARAELKDETWPVFQHFFRLLMDPFIYIRTLELYSLTGVLLAGASNEPRSYLNYDEVLLDFFLTGAPCTSAIYVGIYDLSKVVVDFVQKFMGLKNRDEYQVVESIRGTVEDRKIVDVLKRNFAEFIGEEEQFEEDDDIRQVIEFINNDIEKKLTLDVRNDSYGSFSIKITIT